MTTVIDFKTSAERWKRYSEEHLQEARGLYYDALKTTMTISTFLIGFNVVWLQINPKASLIVKTILFISTISLTVSLMFGRKVLHSAVKFLNKTADSYENKSNVLYNHMLNTKNNVGKEYPPEVEAIKMSYRLYPWQDRVQAVTFYIGVGASIMLVSAMFFNL